jgi:hypothetical protein
MLSHMCSDSKLGMKDLVLGLALSDSKVYILCHLTGPAFALHVIRARNPHSFLLKSCLEHILSFHGNSKLL